MNAGRNGERFTGRTQQHGNDFARNEGRNTYNYAGGNKGREFDQRGNRGASSFRQGLANGDECGPLGRDESRAAFH